MSEFQNPFLLTILIIKNDPGKRLGGLPAVVEPNSMLQN